MKSKVQFNPILMFIILIVITILLSGILAFFNIQADYSTVNTVTNELSNNNVVQVENLLSGSGIKEIATTAITDFVSFAPLSMLIITLMGLGVLEKSGFMKTFFTLITQNFKKNTLTFLLILLSILSTLVGDIGYVVFLPIGALLFKYGHRNPLGGIIAAFAGVSFGYGMNIFLSAIDSSLLTMTLNASHILDPKYDINVFFQLFIMLIAIIITSIVFTRITEKSVMPKLGKYEFDDIETLEDVKITNRQLRGLIVSLGVGFLYILAIIYMIIPGLPLSGALLDHSGIYYIDMLFGTNAVFSQAFVFIITFLFIIVGFIYGFVSKSIKGKDVSDCLSYSLDGIGSILVLIFMASLFISTLKKSNIGLVLTALLSNVIGEVSLTGLGLIILLLVISIIAHIFHTGIAVKWSILSGITVPVFMNASLSPEFAQIIYTAGVSIANGITPVMAYFVIYLAFMEKYNKNGTISIFGSIKYTIPYSFAVMVIWFILIASFYITGLPLGIGSMPGVNYVA